MRAAVRPRRRARALARFAHRHARGFTLVELVVVMALVAIVATVGFARFSDDTQLKARRFGTDAAAMISTAQRLAMAQRRTVYLALDTAGGTVRLCLDAACAAPIAPAPDQSAVLSAPSGLAFTSSASLLSFDAQGRSANAAAVSIRIADAAGTDLNVLVTVEPDTGHVQLQNG